MQVSSGLAMTRMVFLDVTALVVAMAARTALVNLRWKGGGHLGRSLGCDKKVRARWTVGMFLSAGVVLVPPYESRHVEPNPH